MGCIFLEKTKFAVIGCGAIGKVHAHVIDALPNASLNAIVDTNEESGRAVAQQYGCEYYSDYEDMLKNADVDVVSVCVPPVLHSPITISAAKAKKHVICEKPIEVNLERAQAMVDACKENGVKFGVIMQHRFDKPVVLLQKAVADGRLGRILWGSSKTIWYRDEKYFANPQRGTIKYDGGGALINQSIHYVDLLMSVLGDVKSVSGKCRKLRHHQIESEDVGVADVEFKNGAIGTIEGTTAAYPGLYAELCIYGEKGSVIIRNDYLLAYYLESGKDAEFEALLNPEKATSLNTSPAVDETSHSLQYQDFIEAVQTGREPKVTGEDGLKGLQLIKAIYQSSDEKREIYIPS